MNLRPPNLKNKFTYSCRPSYRWQPRGVQALLAPAQGYGAVSLVSAAFGARGPDVITSTRYPF